MKSKMDADHQRDAFLQARYAHDNIRKVENLLRGTFLSYEETDLINQTNTAIKALNEIKEIVKKGGRRKRMKTRRVYKYSIPLGYFSLELPQGAKILTVHERHGKPQIWALVDPNEPFTKTRNFMVVGTGHPIEKDEEVLTYIGTFRLGSEDFIAHLFEIMGEK